MYNFPILIIKGFIIGLAKIVPGVSGSLFALNLGVYEKAINSISNFFKNPKYNLYFLGNLGLGILVAILIGSKILSFFLFKYYLYTMFLFIGLLLGTLPNMMRQNRFKTKSEFLIFIITFLFMMILCFIKSNNKYQYVDTFINNLYIIVIGIIDAATMVIPGISGTAIFMLMGCYEFFLSIFSSISNFENIFLNLKILILFIIGLASGICITTKIMDYLLKYKKNIIYPIIIGLSISSVLILFIDTMQFVDNILNILLGIFIIIAGFKISKFLDFE